MKITYERLFFFFSIFILAFFITSCNSSAALLQFTSAIEIKTFLYSKVGVTPIIPTTVGLATPASTKESKPLLPALPQEINFEASDGQELRGYYFPSASDQPAPLVVLMHWIMGDMSDWYVIAPWLQNRGLQNPFESPTGYGWLNSAWFPDIPDDKSYGVFIFSFRNCWPYPIGCKAFYEEGWTLDAQAALEKAAELDGVDPDRIAAVGSSIGADAVVAACALVNAQQPGSCKGALSISPCNCLKIGYRKTVEMMGKAQGSPPVWCFADDMDKFKCELAEDVENPAFSIFEFPGGGHGNDLLSSYVVPSAMQGLLDFLDEAIGD
jgi:dienelactone hydrolase